MELELEGKVALVTGSSSGLGLEIAQTLQREGCLVAVNGRDPERLGAAAETVAGSFAVAGDVSDPEQAQSITERVVANFGHLDVLVCNVGSGESVPPGEETFPEWQHVFARNLWSATNTIEAARSVLVAREGVIVCVSSICGLEVVQRAPITYSAAKAALNMYVKASARPLGLAGVRINAVAPGNMATEGSVWERRLRTDPDGVEAFLREDVSLGRLVSPSRVAALVAYLASEEAADITGGVFVADGGQVRS